jgi:integrase
VDPDSGKWRWETLAPADARTVETRDAWAIRKREELDARKRELDAGAPKATEKTLSEALALYFESHPKLKPRTVKVYRDAADKLIDLLKKRSIEKAADLTRGALTLARAALVAEPRKSVAAGGKRGERKEASELRSAASINRELRAWKTALGWLIDADQLAKLTRDDLRRALKRETVVAAAQIDYRKPAELKRLISAALEHDAAVFKATRTEHKQGKRGATPRFPAIAPLLVTALLSGCRASELRALHWEDAKEDGLHVHRTASSTKKARVVDLSITPLLAELLETMRPDPPRGTVFKLTADELKAAERRLVSEYKGPKRANLQALRRTCQTFLTCSSVYGAAGPYLAARRGGHSLEVAQAHYLGVITGLDPEAKTLERVMRIETEVKSVIEAARARAK